MDVTRPYLDFPLGFDEHGRTAVTDSDDHVRDMIYLVLFTAQGGTAVHNASLYGACRSMVSNLHAGLESRAVIEQAKGVLHAELGVSPEEAFHLLSRYSQNTNQRVRKVSARLVQGLITAGEFRPSQTA